MTEQQTPGTEIRVRGPIPFDVAGTLISAIGRLYPGALLGKSHDYRDALVMIIPDDSRPGIPLPAGEVALDVIGLDVEGLRLSTPEQLIAPLAAWVDQQFEETGAENYLEQTVSVRDKRHRYVLNFRRVEGKTPHELRQVAEHAQRTTENENRRLRKLLAASTRRVARRDAKIRALRTEIDWRENDIEMLQDEITEIGERSADQ